MAENNQLSDEKKNNSTDTSSTDASSAVIGNHENAVVPHKISNHDKLVQTMVMVDGEWINVNDTNDQANMKEDMHKVNKKVVEAQKGIVEAKNTADSAVKYADSAVSASKVNSDALVAQSSAISEAKAAADDAASKAQFIKENASSEAAAIRNQVADVANNVSSVKADVASAASDVANLKVDVQTKVNNIVDGKGYATTSTVQSLVDQKAGTLSDTITELDRKISDNHSDSIKRIQSLTASIDGLQSRVTNYQNDTSSKYTQLSDLMQSKVNKGDLESVRTQLASSINERIQKGNLITRFNLEAGRTLIQSNKIYFDADSFVMSPNSKAFIPSAYITNINADKITTGTLDAAKFNVKNLSADSITSGTLDGIKFKTEFTNDNGISIMGDRIAWTSMTSFGEQLNGWIENSTRETDWLSFGDLRLQSVSDVGVDTKGTDDVTRWSISDYNPYDKPGLMVSNFHRYIPDESRYDDSPDADQSNAVLLASTNTYISVRRRTGILAHLDSKIFSGDSIFSIQKDNKVGFYVGQGRNGNQINVQFAGDDSGFNIHGNFNVYGAKNSAVKTSQGDVAVSAYETAEYYFGDIGEGQTGDSGLAFVGIEKLFSETVNTSIPYQVFITAYGPGNLWVDQREHDRFVVKSDRPNVKFGWEIKAKRRGYENTRLQKVN